MKHDGIQQLARKPNVILLHDNERIKNSIAKKNAGNSQDGNDDLSEARDFAGALQDASCHEVPDENRSVQKNVIYRVSDQPPSQPAYRRRAQTQHQSIWI